MCRLIIPIILYLTYCEGQHYPANNPVVLNNEHPNPTYPLNTIYPGTAPHVDNGVNKNYPSERLSIISGSGKSVLGSEPSLDLDDDSSGSDTNTDHNSLVDGHSYYEDLELVENFGNYLKRRSQLDGSSSAINDAGQQYSALFAALLGLAKVIRSSCTESFDQVYEQVYLPTVDAYYKYGLANPEKVPVLIEGYISKGNAHIPKLRKLKKNQCEKDPFCPVSLDSKINSSLLFYLKELETLDAVANLARNYYYYIEQFDLAAQKGNVLFYLHNNQEKLKNYVMHIINTEEHITDKVVCP